MQSPRFINTLNLITWLLSSVFYAFQMTLRVLPVIMAGFLSKNAGLNPSELGLIAGVYYIGYSAAHIPMGICLEKYQPRNVIALSILLCVGGIYMMTFADTTHEIIISRLIVGVGSAAGILGASKVSLDFYRSKYAVMLGFAVMIGVCGAYYGAQPVERMLQEMPLEHVMQSLGLFGIVLAAAVWCLYVPKKSNAVMDISSTIKNKNFWIIGLIGGLMVGPLEGFADFWGSRYLMDVQGLTAGEAGFSITMIFIGLGVGCPMFGLISQKYSNLRKVAIFACCSLLICMLALLSQEKLQSEVVHILCLLLGIFSAYQVVLFAMALREAGAGSFSLGAAIVNMTIMIFGFVYHFAIGLILNNNGEYVHALSVIIIGIALGIIGLFVTGYDRTAAKI